MNPLKIGNVVGVESGRVDVRITAEDMTLIHDGRTYRIGQLGSYVTLPSDDRNVVGFVVAVNKPPNPAGEPEFPTVIHVQLIGEIRSGSFTRGVNEYPVIGDDVWVANRSDFETIFGSFDQLLSGSKQAQSFSLGKFAHDPDFDVKVLGSPFFAKHVTVLGNSGSGKSCTTARILQEVLDYNQAQVVMFDMHGEYRSAFSDEDGQLNANVTYLGADELVLPYWLLRYEEFEALFVDRSDPRTVSTQISFLRTALLEFKQDAAAELGLTKTLTLDTPIYFSLEKLKTYATNLNAARFVLNDDRLAFSQLALRSLHPDEQQKLMRNQACQFNRGNPEGETPHPMFFGKLLGLIDSIDTKYDDRRYEFLMKPLEHGHKSRYFRDYLKKGGQSDQTANLMNHLIKLLTGRMEPRSNLTIIDLSGIPFEIVDITVAVLTRLLFDLNFWTPAEERHPIVLCFEEAHNYIPREEKPQQFAKTAVERVAKEGRKYGVSAMVVSQRPSELSETVLAQCNSFVIMRMSNPQDQHYVSKVVGDHFAGIIQMLPMLRPGEAFIIGDSVLMPMRTLVTRPDPLPQSSDVDFFKHWAAADVRNDLDEIINHWRRQDRRRIVGAPEDDQPDDLEEESSIETASEDVPPPSGPVRPSILPPPPIHTGIPGRKWTGG